MRLALDFLRDEVAATFTRLGGDLFWDPWAARNAYIQLILDQGLSRSDYFTQQSRHPLSLDEEVRALALLEAQRNSLLMFTSCGWFFSELSGLETVQIMRYAARVIELQTQLGLQPPRKKFLEMMAEAKSNVPQRGNGADIYLRFAEPLPVVVPAEPTAVLL